MSSKCLHCESQNSDTRSDFCCSGCASAYQIINNLGFNSYYKSRFIKPGEKILKPEESNFSNISEFVTKNAEGVNSIHLMVEGIHCAACIWLIESVLKKQQNVRKARINMSTRRLYLEWDGRAEEGNDLVKLIANLGYKLIPFDPAILEEIDKKYDSTLLKAMSVAGFAAGNLMLISVALWSSSLEVMGKATRDLLYWVSALIALPTIIYSGGVFFSSALNAIKARRTNMDVPISIAIILASLVSLFETITIGEHVYFDSAVMLIFFLLIGRYLDFGARKKAMQVSSDLVLLSSSFATVLENGQSKIIPTKEIKKDMILLVAMGEKIAADGMIFEGESEIDTSIITGESLPKKTSINEEVFAGTINLSSPIKVRVTKAKDETLLSQIVKLVENIEQNKNYYTRIADKVSKYYTPFVHILAALSFVLWFYYFKSSAHHALLIATAVLIITCPCALALAVPVVQIMASSRLMKKGILLKSGDVLEKLSKINTVIFDKTGTLTLGKPVLIASYLISEKEKKPLDQNQEIFAVASSLAAHSRHPLSKSLTSSYKNKILPLEEINEIPGRGISGNYNGKEVKLGKYDFSGLKPDHFFKKNENNHPEIFVNYDGKIAQFIFQDVVRSDAKEVIAQLKNLGKKIILLSGDKKSTVEDIASQLEITEFYFEKTPIEKIDCLKNFKEKYGQILMVGDGLNDAPAVVFADASISPVEASDITQNAADIVFQGSKLFPVLEIFHVAKKSRALVMENFALSLIYNLVAVPFAVMGYVVPLFAALAMSSSSILVVLNALRIKEKK